MICLVFLLLLLSTAFGDISQQCLDCICMQESYGCQPLGCRWDRGSPSCGYFQIKSLYYIDCGEPGSDWRSCSRDKSCSERCVRAYMRRYGRHCTGRSTQTCEDYAKMHKGGPTGCNNPSMEGYWEAVKSHGCNEYS